MVGFSWSTLLDESRRVKGGRLAPTTINCTDDARWCCTKSKSLLIRLKFYALPNSVSITKFDLHIHTDRQCTGDILQVACSSGSFTCQPS